MPLNTLQVLQWGVRVEVLAEAVGLSEACCMEHGILQCLILHPNPSGSGWQVAMQLLLGHHWPFWPWLGSDCLESPGYCNWHRAAWGFLSCVARSGAWWKEAASAADPCARLPSRPLLWPCC